MYFWKNRGLIYSVIIGYIMPFTYFKLLDLVASYIEIPFSGYLIENFSYDVKFTTSIVMFGFDALMAIIISLIVAFPLGRVGYGNVGLKIILFTSAFYVSLVLQEGNNSYISNFIQLVYIPELLVYVFLSGMAIYFGNKEYLISVKKHLK